MSTEKTIPPKATSDLMKRTGDSLGLVQKDTTFVFVTSRKWSGKNNWVEEKKKKSPWKEIRAYDASDLEQWLEAAPLTSLWFGRLIGKPAEDVQTLQSYWETLQDETDPAISPKAFLSGRQVAVAKFNKWVGGEPDSLSFAASSAEELVDFCVAALIANEDEREADAARTLIVKTPEAWAYYSRQTTPLILIAHPRMNVTSDLVISARKMGHHALIFEPGKGISGSIERLPHAEMYQLRDALAESGIGAERAYQLARGCSGKLVALKRRLSCVPGGTQPEWSKSEEAAKLIPLMLAGSWDEKLDSDREIIHRLANDNYETVAEAANRFGFMQDAPIERVGSKYRIVGREDVWAHLLVHLTPFHLERFVECAKSVLEEENPALDLASENRWSAAVYGKGRKYSDELRAGLSGSIALLGCSNSEMEREASNCGGLQQHAKRVVRDLLNEQDWMRWASLNDVLPDLAEAAPEQFLEALEPDLKNNDPQALELFRQASSSWPGRIYHTGLLWALEALAWAPKHLSRCADALARLSEIDPGGNYGNRPSSSLHAIFLPWRPHTMATWQDRLQILSKLIPKFPEEGRQLCESLLPKYRDTISDTYLPQWRDWHLQRESRVFVHEHNLYVDGIAECLLKTAEASPGHWIELIRAIPQMPPWYREKIVSGLDDAASIDMIDEDKRIISEALLSLIHDWEEFPDERWTLESAAINKISALVEVFEPSALYLRYQPLFLNQALFRIGRKRGDCRDNDDELASQRESAVTDILQAHGIDGLRKFCDCVEDVHALAWITGHCECQIDEKPLLGMAFELLERNLQFFGAYIHSRFYCKGWSWVDAVDMADWTEEQIGKFSTCLPFDRSTWQFVDKKGTSVQSVYWAKVREIYRGDCTEELAEGIRHLLDAKRPVMALEVLRLTRFEKLPLASGLLMEVLKMTLQCENGDREASRLPGLRPAILQIIRRLQERSDVRVEDMESIEFSFLQMLGGHKAEPKFLLQRLARDPVFFVEILSKVYRSKNEPEGYDSGIDKGVSANAHRLLKSFKQVPGVDKDGEEARLILSDWINTAREKSDRVGRLEICEILIGQLFAHAPSVDDGPWPCKAVCEIVEDVESNDLDRGLFIGIRNRRGCFWRRARGEGSEECGLSEKYEELALRIEISFPRTAVILRRVADEYERETRAEDDRL